MTFGINEMKHTHTKKQENIYQEEAIFQTMNKKPNFITIAVDFDGTIIKGGQYPDAKNPIPHAIDCLKRLSGSDKVRLILWSCRDHESDTAAFDNMMRFLDEQGIHFDAVNDNLPEIVELYGTNSRKITCDYYIDDKAVLPAMVNG